MTQLTPVEQRDDNGQVVAVTDPVADIVAYLMSRPAGDWTPTAGCHRAARRGHNGKRSTS